MQSERRRRALNADGTIEHIIRGRCLCRAGNGADQLARAQEGRHGKRDGLLGDKVKACKAAVVYLLHAADIVQLHFLGKVIVKEVGDRGIRDLRYFMYLSKII